jgi:Outer membrane lipoprotein-sorting protein
MNFLRSMTSRVPAAILVLNWLISIAGATGADPAPNSARDLADHLSALQDGMSYTRFRLEVKQPGDTTRLTLQLQIKERRTRNVADVVYQVLWPKERKGEAVLLHKANGGAAAGSLLMPPDKLITLNASQMSASLFESDLSYQDVIENFFAWENQTIVGNDVVDHVNCVILESRPGRAGSSTYASVRSWIDPRRFVPLRVEKYMAGGRLVRRIDATRVVADDKGRFIPAGLTVRGLRTDSYTNLDGSRIRHDVAYSDREFTPEGLSEITAPPSAPE